MPADDVNFGYFETEKDRRMVLDAILSCFGDREWDSQESEETVFDRIVRDSELVSAEQVLRALKHICITVWCDDLYDGTPYADAVHRLNQIGNRPLTISEIVDDYERSEKGADFKFSMTTDGTIRTVMLNHGRYLHYKFLGTFLEAIKGTDLQGKYYALQNDYIEDGLTLLFLTPEEHSKLTDSGLVIVYELTEAYINECTDSFWEPYKPPKAVSGPPPIKHDPIDAQSIKLAENDTVSDSNTPPASTSEPGEKPLGITGKQAIAIVFVIWVIIMLSVGLLIF